MTPRQRDIMKHALGAGKGRPGWRNYFVTGPGSDDYDDCEALVAPGCKTPAGCSENGCLGWCDDHRPEARAGVEDLQREVARLKVENARLAEETMRLQRMLNAAHQIVGELARPSGI